MLTEVRERRGGMEIVSRYPSRFLGSLLRVRLWNTTRTFVAEVEVHQRVGLEPVFGETQMSSVLS